MTTVHGEEFALKNSLHLLDHAVEFGKFHIHFLLVVNHHLSHNVRVGVDLGVHLFERSLDGAIAMVQGVLDVSLVGGQVLIDNVEFVPMFRLDLVGSGQALSQAAS